MFPSFDSGCPLELIPEFSIGIVRVSIAVMRYYDQKAAWGGKGSVGLYFHTIVHH